MLKEENQKSKIKNQKYETVVIGVSAGGFEALQTILPFLPKKFPVPVIIVQHLHHTSGDFVPEHLNRLCQLHVKEAQAREAVTAGKIYIAPPEYHLLIEENRRFSLSVDIHANYSRPSIDVLFETAADVYMDKLIGIILTGANSDGSQGLLKIKGNGGLTIVQRPKTAQFSAMPLAAITLKAADFILTLREIPNFLINLTGANNGY